MVDVKDVDFAYQDENPIIHHITLAIEKGERVAIIGKNGYGKSTLLRLIAGELTPKKGEIRICRSGHDRLFWTDEHSKVEGLLDHRRGDRRG